MAEQYPFEQPTPQDADVVFFSPELLKLADAHRRRQHLEECRQAADNGDCAAAVQMGVNYLYGTAAISSPTRIMFFSVSAVR